METRDEMTMEPEEISNTRDWSELIPPDLSGGIVILGDTDTGKSTLSRRLMQQLAENRGAVGWIDGDIGQSTLGLPTTTNLALVEEPPHEIPKARRSFFVGSANATGHFLQILTGLKRLQEEALDNGVKALVIDTMGFVDRKAGGLALLEWEIELLRPRTCLVLQHGDELEPVLAPLRLDPSRRVIDLPISSNVRSKSREERIRNRRTKFQQYFETAAPWRMKTSELPVHHPSLARRFSLLGFLDGQGFCLGLGIVLNWDESEAEVLTPLRETTRVAAIRMAATLVDPVTGLEVM